MTRPGSQFAIGRERQRATNFLSPGANTSTLAPWNGFFASLGHARNLLPPVTGARSFPSSQGARIQGAWKPVQLVLEKTGQPASISACRTWAVKAAPMPSGSRLGLKSASMQPTGKGLRVSSSPAKETQGRRSVSWISGVSAIRASMVSKEAHGWTCCPLGRLPPNRASWSPPSSGGLEWRQVQVSPLCCQVAACFPLPLLPAPTNQTGAANQSSRVTGPAAGVAGRISKSRTGGLGATGLGCRIDGAMPGTWTDA